MSKIALYAGSFDPFTRGHLAVVQQAAQLFDRLIIVVAGNPNKTAVFTVDERWRDIELVLDAEEASLDARCAISVQVSPSLVADLAAFHRATHLVRGLRGASDLEYEMMMARVNEDLSQHRHGRALSTIFVTPPRELSEVSSSMVRELWRHNMDQTVLRAYVPSLIAERLYNRGA